MAALNREERILLNKFFLFGVLFGLLFPVMALSLDLWFKELPFGIEQIELVHLTNPIHFIIDSAPIILALTAYLIGKMVIKRERKTKSSLEQELAKSKKIYAFTKNMLEGRFTESDDLDNEEEFQSLIALRDKILTSKIKEDNAKWIREGLNKFNELIRLYQHNKNLLSSQILNNLVSYLNANLAVIYLIEDIEATKPVYAVQATYAFKYDEEKKIEAGEGLVGQAVIEKRILLITEVPDDYTNIKSGLGKGLPQSIIISPLLFNETVFGVIEIASMKEFKPHQVEFVKQISEYLAYTFSFC